MDDSPANRVRPVATSVLDLGSKDDPIFLHSPIRIRIPLFPAFKTLELSDQFEIEQWVKHFPPYSDFNFVSLWSWNTTGGFEVSWLNDNLIVLFNDYGTGERFLSFIGTRAVTETATALLHYAGEHDIIPELRLLPQETARQLRQHSGLSVSAAPEHSDYVLSTLAWSSMHGGHFKNKRNEIARFEREHTPEIRAIDLTDPEIQRQMTDVFGRWVVQRGRTSRQDTVLESLAVRRIFSLHRPGDLLAFGAYVNGEMIGYTINERLGGGYAMGHHWKVAGDYPGAYPMMLRHTCRVLAAEGIRFLNIQQDLGEPGLARSKRLYQPVLYLYKYQITPDSGQPDDGDTPLVFVLDAPHPAEIETGWMGDAHVG